MNETDFMNEIRIMLTEKGFAVFRANVGTVRTPDGRFINTGLPKGFSDLFAVKDGKIYFLEVKVKPNRPTKEQINFVEQMKSRYNCRAGIVYNFNDVKEVCEIGQD